MLVLSRRADQQILFPNLGITLRILQVKGKTVKVGIDAPENIRVIRPENFDPGDLAEMQSVEGPVDRHHLRNRLNAISLGLRLLQKQIAAGMVHPADDTMRRVLAELGTLDQEVGAARTTLHSVASNREIRLLVVEDDDNERELLAGLLRLHGFSVDTAKDGREALDYLEAHDRPDLVLLDMKMPEFDGRYAIQRIRADRRLADLTVFAVSGTSPESMGLQEGWSGWFPKPLDPERLIGAIRDRAGLLQLPT